MRVIIADITQQSILSLDHTFYLTIIETKFKTRVPKDHYDLKGFAKLMQMTNKESMTKIGIHIESLQRTKVLELRRVSDAKKSSGHVVICIDGFLSEDSNKSEQWANVQTWYKNAEVYALTWTSCSVSDFFSGGTITDPNQSKSKISTFLNAVNLCQSTTKQFIFA
jgi:hypothetical protein